MLPSFLRRILAIPHFILFAIAFAPTLAARGVSVGGAPSAALSGTSAAAAACTPSWTAMFGGMPGVSGGFVAASVKALCVFDDGGGPALYAGGDFFTAGGVTATSIAKWDGTSWHALGGINFHVNALTVFDDGTGAALYVAGEFTNVGGVAANDIARWNGTSWSALGSGLGGSSAWANTLAVFDDGSGPALYVGGSFTTAGGVAANRIAKWDGVTWSPLGSGLLNTSVDSLAVFDDGSGPALYAGGSFTGAGGIAASRIAKWDGTSWSALGSGTNSSVDALAVFDDGGGPALYVGGSFTTAGGVAANRIAMWDGVTWSPLGSGITNATPFPMVRDLAVFDDGNGPALYATGNFQGAGAFLARHVARWNGSSWSTLGSGVASTSESHPGGHALAVFDDGNGSALYAGGEFTTAGGHSALSIARWRGSGWSALGDGLNASVRALLAFDDGSGPALYVGGGFTSAGGGEIQNIAKWDGAQWSALGAGANGPVFALAAFDDGSGPALYVGGFFTHAGGSPASNVAKWDGTSWSALGAGTDRTVQALATFDDGSGPALYAGGYFTSAGGGAASRIARWDGTSWSSVGVGTNSTNERIGALVAFDDGSGTALYAGGYFTSVGGLAASAIARWDGSSWSTVGSGVDAANGQVYCLTPFDDGTGPALYVGGFFTSAGGVGAKNVARWNGSSWSAVGSGMGGPNDAGVAALEPFDDGSGPQLYAGGTFTIADGAAALRVAKWNGTAWSPLDDGTGGTLPDSVHALAALYRGGSTLYLGGSFASGPAGDSYLTSWRGCGFPLGASFCFGDASCPCVPPNTVPAPPAAPGHGCANSLNLGGARLAAHGTTSPDTVTISVYVAPNYLGFGFLVKGDAVDSNGIASSDGIRCADGQLIRFGSHNAGTNGDPVGQWSYPNSAQTTPVSSATLQPAGQSAYYQLHYRNAAPKFCTSATSNWSNGQRIDWP